jgi:SecD/SecF fusion protein
MDNKRFWHIVIFLVLIISLINVYPTAGWMTLTEDEKEKKIAGWQEEDDIRLGQDIGVLGRYKNSIVRWAQFDNTKLIDLGLDLKGGIQMIVGFDYDESLMEERELSEKDVQQLILSNIVNRTNEFEVTEPSIQALGTNQVQVQLPGQTDVERAKDLILTPGVLGFHMAAGPTETDNTILAIDRATNNKLIPFLQERGLEGFYRILPDHFDTVEEVLEKAKADGLLPEGKVFGYSPPPKKYADDPHYLLYLITEEAEMGGENLKMAAARPDQQSPGQWQIIFEFNSDGSRDFAELTEKHVGEQMAIVLDGYVMSAPNINERIFGSGNISGSFTNAEAKDLAITLNSGSLPVEIRNDQTTIVGPILGQDSIKKGVTSSLVGLVLVMIFMIFYYRVGGILANISLAINAIILLGAFAYFNVTLTLPGIAGLILTIGMAVDANVLIFERMREEARQGKSLGVAIENGYALASSAILDANVTTLIAAVVLTQFGTGPVQGFALALSIGVCSSVFAALIVTRSLLEFISERKMVANIAMMSLLKGESKLEFMSKRQMAAIVSLVVIAIGLGTFAMRGKDMLGVDFTSGTNILVALDKEREIGEESIRDAITDAGIGAVSVQRSVEVDSDNNNQFTISIPLGAVDEDETAPEEQITSDESAEGTPSESAEENAVETAAASSAAAKTVSSKVNAALQSVFTTVDVMKVDTIGPAVGAQLQRDAINAIFFALLFIVFYLWFRFEWKFAVGAVVALVHDVLVVLGVLALTQRELSIPVIAALLTIIGYSLNDTIVVFDRVREDLALNKKRGLNFLNTLNASINRTLSRTLLTSLTTLFVVVVLYFFGGSAINDFALALIAGVIVGTYSSIFVATPSVFFLNQWVEKRRAAKHEAEANKGRNRPAKA